MPNLLGEYGYVHGKLGPHSSRVDEALRNLEHAGVLARGSGGIGIADGGREMAEDLLESEDGDMRATLGRYKRLFSGITREELLSLVYSAYPETLGSYPMTLCMRYLLILLFHFVPPLALLWQMLGSLAWQTLRGSIKRSHCGSSTDAMAESG